MYRYVGLYSTLHYCTSCLFFFFNDTATTEIYTLSLHDALPISKYATHITTSSTDLVGYSAIGSRVENLIVRLRSEEHTSELQSRQYLVCRLLLEKKKKKLMYATQ